MDVLILLTYSAIVIAVFKFAKVPVNGYTIVTAALGGIGILATLLLLMNYNHPFTSKARFYFHTTPIVPQVQGRVIEVHVTDAQAVKAGDILFKIDPQPYQYIVDQKKALLASAESRAKELELDLLAFEQAYNAAVSDEAAAKDTFERDKQLVANSAVSKSEFEQAKQNYVSAQARTSQAQAQLARAKQSTDSTIGGINTQVADATSQLATAQFNLDETTVRAPTDGKVLQLMLRPGMMAVPIPLKPVIIFQHDEPPYFVASFLQNNAQRITPGAEAEVILPAVPGRFFKGEVELVGAAVAQGQLQPTGDLLDVDQATGEGRINVRIRFADGELDGFQIIPGSTGQAAVYSDHVEEVAVMRKVLLRMKSWTNFIFSDGH